MTSDKATSLEERLNALITGDTWRSLSLNGAWTGSLSYRLGMDRRHVVLEFTGSNPGGQVGDGSKYTIATLPAGYRPKHGKDLPLSTDKPGTQSPHVFVDTDGTVNVYGVSSTAAYVSLCQIMPIVDD